MSRPKGKAGSQFGNLPPQYKFILNPYPDVRFSTCPGCGRKTKQRKLPLVIHVNPHHLLALNKTCRYCPDCDLLIAHQDEIEELLTAMFMQYEPAVIGNDYLVIGTMERRAWREGVNQPQSVADQRKFMRDFKEYRTVEYTPAHWADTPKSSRKPGRKK